MEVATWITAGAALYLIICVVTAMSRLNDVLEKIRQSQKFWEAVEGNRRDKLAEISGLLIDIKYELREMPKRAAL